MLLENQIADQALTKNDLLTNLKMQKKIKKDTALHNQIEGGQTFMLNQGTDLENAGGGAAAGGGKRKKRGKK